MNARIVGLTQIRGKGGPYATLTQAVLIQGLGMQGNLYQGGERQLSLLSLETRQWMNTQTPKGLCFGRFHENILTEGIILEDLAPGCHLRIGETILRISMQTRHCYRDCVLFSQGTECRLSTNAVFATVEQSGLACIGDVISLVP